MKQTIPAVTSANAPVSRSAPMTSEERKVIFASSLGTVFEWYDFYLYGTLAGIIGAQYFTPLDVGACQASCRLVHAANGCLLTSSE